jgi:hypothetical protein
MMWAALYQQRPAPEEGDYFKADWLKPYEALPPRETLRVYGGSDYAVTADGGDYTVHIVVGLDPEGRMYLMDLWRKQTASDEWIEAFCDLVTLWKPVGWAEEKGQISAGIVLPSISGSESLRRSCIDSSFPPVVIRRLEPNPFAAGWPWKDCMFPRRRAGTLRFDQSC